MTDSASKADIIEVVNTWSFTRDQGRWDECAATFTPAGQIAVSWFQGPHSGFIAASSKGVGGGFSKHMMLGTVAKARGHRGFAETSVLLSMRAPIHGVDAVGTSLLRFLDKFERTAAGWQIVDRRAVFDSDHFMAESPNAPIPFDMDVLTALPRPYRYLAYGLRATGATVALDLPTVGSAAEARIRADGLAWVDGGI